MSINANESLNESASCTKEASMVQHSNGNSIAIVGSHINSFGDTSSLWGTPFLPNISQTSKSNETVTKHGNQMEVTSEEDQSSSWGTLWSINSANTPLPNTENSHRFFSLHQSSLHSNQCQWKSQEQTGKNTSFLVQICENILCLHCLHMQLEELLQIHFLPIL